MASARGAALLGGVALLLLCSAALRRSSLGVRGVLLLAGRTLLALGLVSGLVSATSRWLSSRSLPPPQASSAVPEDEVDRKRDVARRELQDQHSARASMYQEAVLRPRQELRVKKKEEDFHRMTGGSWRLTVGQALGGAEDSEGAACADQAGIADTPNREAVRRRKLPESATRTPTPPPPPRQKRVIVLPDEPPEDAEGAVRVALRCPSGRTFRRTFLTTHSSQVLLDWMLKVGYHPALYAVCTTFPRTALHTGRDLTLAQAGIEKDTVLNVDERDPSTT
ncbi:UBX domain-containing protein 8 [Amia ocellicauda]|uniref:UBX domain-containing protein 8 n=1 Tax=Amia ocellicauda TaxID=2972642 RepID=UPI0034649F4B